jgi:hypothetical protein
MTRFANTNPPNYPAPFDLLTGLGEGVVCVVRAVGGGASLNHWLIDMTLPGSNTHATQRATHTCQLQSLIPDREKYNSGCGESNTWS